MLHRQTALINVVRSLGEWIEVLCRHCGLLEQKRSHLVWCKAYGYVVKISCYFFFLTVLTVCSIHKYKNTHITKVNGRTLSSMR